MGLLDYLFNGSETLEREYKGNWLVDLRLGGCIQ